MFVTAITLALLGADPKVGYDQLVNGTAVRCGIPASIWFQVSGKHKPVFSGRRGMNQTLSDGFTATRGKSGIDVVSPNCLQCHAGSLLGKPVMGLGNAFVDQTIDPLPMATFGRQFLGPGAMRDELDRFIRPLAAASPHTTTDTIGVSSADDLAAVLMAHRDRKTLAWNADAKLDTGGPVPVDIPAWWLARDKSSVFATGIGKGKRSTLMATAALLCADTVQDAERIIASFSDVPAYVDTLQPPKWPWSIDAELASTGSKVFTERCAGCHSKAEVIPLERVGTDSLLFERTAVDATPWLAWFNESVYGRTAQLVATKGYVAQPLKGVWATAPYFHNGSVPTLDGVLDSSKRPGRWTRPNDSNAYDSERVGWKHAQPAERVDARTYDTTRPGYGNGGHTFADALDAESKRALLEYLKTL